MRYLLLVLVFSVSCATQNKREIASISYNESFERIVNTNTQISINVLEKAFWRYQDLENKISNKRFVGIIDYNKHSSEKRFFIIDLETENIFSYLVTHGRGNDKNNDGVPEHFSKIYRRGAGEAPLGSFITFDTYSKYKRFRSNSSQYGDKYFGLRIKGHDKSNQHAEYTGIVIQTSSVYPPLIKNNQTITSIGSYVIKFDKFQEIENMLKDGAFVYVGK